MGRQTYAFLALKLFDEQALDHAQYAQDVLPSLLDLSYDKVPNLRLAVARVLNQIRQMTYFVKEANPHHGRMEQVIEELSKDDDADVKAFLQIPQMYDSDGEPINDIQHIRPIPTRLNISIFAKTYYMTTLLVLERKKRCFLLYSKFYELFCEICLIIRREIPVDIYIDCYLYHFN